MTKRFTLTDYDELYYITDMTEFPGFLPKEEKFLVEHSMTGDEVCAELNRLNDENENFKSTALALMQAYKNLNDETDGLVLGNAMKERIYALEDLFENLGLHDLIKENGVDKID